MRFQSSLLTPGETRMFMDPSERLLWGNCGGAGESCALITPPSLMVFVRFPTLATLELPPFGTKVGLQMPTRRVVDTKGIYEGLFDGRQG